MARLQRELLICCCYKPRRIIRFFSSPSSSFSSSSPTAIRNRDQFYASLFCTLIHLFLRCRRLSRAVEAFSVMRRCQFTPPELRAWNDLLNHFNSAGMVNQVMLLYHDMNLSGVKPNVITKNIVVHSLCKLGDFDCALELLRNNYQERHGFESDVVTYNTLIWGFFCKHGYVDLGLSLVSEMLKRGISCDDFTRNILIKGFCEKGMLGNAMLVMRYLLCSDSAHGSVISFNTLIHGYCKAGDLNDAVHLMNTMWGQGIQPDVVTYNTLINGFCEMGDFDAATRLMNELLELRNSINGEDEKKCSVVPTEGVRANRISYTSLISGYGKHLQAEKALSLYSKMVENGIDPDVVTLSCVMNELLKSGRLHEAMSLFREMLKMDPNHVSFSILLDFLLKNGNTDAAFNLQSQLVVRGLAFDVVLFSIFVHGFFNIGRRREAEDMFLELLVSNVVPNCVAYSAMVNGLCKTGDMEAAESLMSQMEAKNIPPNVITYSSLIDGYVKQRKPEAAIRVMEKMIREGVLPNSFTYASLIDGFLKSGNTAMAESLYDDMKSRGLGDNVYVMDAFFNSLRRSGRLNDAVALFENSGLLPDRVNYTSLMDGLFEDGKQADAFEVAREMASKKIGFDTIARNVLLKGLLKIENHEVDSVYNGLLQDGFDPDHATFRLLIDAYCRREKFSEACELLWEMKSRGLKPNEATMNHLVSRLCESAQVDRAMLLLSSFPGFHPNATVHRHLINAAASESERGDTILTTHGKLVEKGLKLDVSVYNAVIVALSRLKLIRKASSVFREMREAGFSPDTVTYNALIQGYSKACQPEKAFALFSRMKTDGVPPNVATYNILIGASIDKAEGLVSEMKERNLAPNAATFDALIAGYGKAGDMKKSVTVYCEAIARGFVPRVGTYNAAMNGFSKAGKMEHAAELMNEMRKRGVAPNSSSYDVLIGGWCELAYREGSSSGPTKRACRLEARKMFEEMCDKGLAPCEATVRHLSFVVAKPGKTLDARRMLTKLFSKGKS